MSAVKVLTDELKKQGLNIAEDTAVSACKAVIKSLPAFLLATENKYDDMLIPLLGVIEPNVLALLDKIDGEDDPNR